MYLEKRKEKVASLRAFYFRLIKYLGVSLVLLFFSLGIGIAGYMYFAELNFIDSLLNASMILTGMGPISQMNTDSAKLFASFYSIYSGVAFLGISAVIVAPLAHRILHLFHAEIAEEE